MILKNKVGIVLLGVVLIVISCVNPMDRVNNSINPILGDVSFMNKFGTQPTEKTDEQLRIKTHLQYVEQTLRNKTVSELSDQQKTNRKHILNLLNEYWLQGVFPKNYDYSETRKPCFVDQENRLCAVAYLIDKTAGRDVVTKINQDYKYADILDMENELMNNWINNSGLTKTEYAMIQPTYIQIEPIEPILIEPELIELRPVWYGNGHHKIVNKKNQLIESGWFKNYKLIRGKKYFYTIKGEVEKVEVYKEGQFIKLEGLEN